MLTKFHGFQNTGSKSFSTEDFLFGIKAGTQEFLEGQPKTSTPNKISTQVYDTKSTPVHNPMTSTPRETPAEPHQVLDTRSSSEPDLTYLEGQDPSEATPLRGRKQPNMTEKHNPIEQVLWQIKNRTRADLTNVTREYESLLQEVTEHNNYQTTDYHAISCGVGKIDDWKIKMKKIAEDMTKINNKDLKWNDNINLNLEDRINRLQSLTSSAIRNLETADVDQCIFSKRIPQICPQEIVSSS